MIDPNLDHVGIVVPRLEPALQALSASLGLEWLPIFDGVMSMHSHTVTRGSSTSESATPFSTRGWR